MPNNEYGDFQTPLDLAAQCLKVVELPASARVFEPTCGTGAFLKAASMIAPSSERFGIEINPNYAHEASQWGQVNIANVFEVSLPEAPRWNSNEPLFIVGNPPWVTAAELRRMNSGNIPRKENFKKVKGLDALLGSSNFDVCEYVILKILREFSKQPFTFGMLCKTQTARNVTEYAASIGLPFTNARIYRINALKWFNAGVDACWFTLDVAPSETSIYTVSMHEDVFNPDASPTSKFGVVDSLLVSNVDKYASVREANGTSPYTWRSGMKHDASSVFELVATPRPTTKAGIEVNIESNYVYPLLKSTDIFRGRHRELRRWVVVPQMKFGDETDQLRTTAPNLWNYLEANADALDGRKSSIYRNRPRFSVFGHGEYTFAPYKVAISGLHKQPIFRLIAPINGKPVVLDDTCYFVPFRDETEAAVATALLNSPSASALIESIVFWDSKRPITKKLLSRIDLNRLPFDTAAVLASTQAIARQSELSIDSEKAIQLIGHLGTQSHRKIDETLIPLW